MRLPPIGNVLLAFGLLSFAASSGHTQELTPNAVLPNAPSQDEGIPTNARTLSMGSTPFATANVRDLSIESYTKPRTIDHQFLLLNAALIVSAFADGESTLKCVRRPGCKETNPLLGSHPTAGRIFAVGVPITALTVYLSYHYKRISPTQRWWKAFPGVAIGAHLFGTVNNLAAAYGR